MHALEVLQVLKFITKPHKSDLKFLQGIEAWVRGGKDTTRKQDWRLSEAYRRSQDSGFVRREVIKR
jgi:hypothetical protein